MNTLQKIYGLVNMFAAAAQFNRIKQGGARYKFPLNEEVKRKQIELKQKRGLRYYDINGTLILALNKKNAERKYNNKTI